ncbi:MAG TPA: ISNCY family transposase [Blastocatellia bacterium]|nr:ISNCY family transposase [Blastocatellia bacterium]
MHYSPAAVERAMKIQEVMLRAISKKITWWQAAEILGLSCRQMRLWKRRYEEHGYNGLFDHRWGKPSPKRVPLATVEQVLMLYREQYFDFNVRHFHEKLKSEHDIHLSYTWVKQALQGAGLVKKTRPRRVHRKRRERRPLPGMLLHIDASTHRWFGDARRYDFLVIMDDATSEVYYAQLVEQEESRSVLRAIRQVVEERGLFCALYSDRASHFYLTPRAGELVDRFRLTQVGRCLQQLGVQMIAAYSPQARGRSERAFRTWQGRLPQELRLQRLTTVEEANAYLRQTYTRVFNEKFTVGAVQAGTAFVPVKRTDLELVFSLQHERVVNRDNTVSFSNLCLQIERTKWDDALRLPGDGLRTPGRIALSRIRTARRGPIRHRWKVAHRQSSENKTKE